MTQRYIGGLIYNPPGGYSGYFNGSSSLSISSSNTVLPTGTQDFCVEMWFSWQTQSGSYPQLIANPTTNGFQIYYDVASGLLAVGIFNVSNVITYTISQTALSGGWNHLAVTRSGNTFRLFLNGILQANGTNTISFASVTTQYIGSDGSRPYTGYLSNVRTVLGAIPTPYQTSSTTNGTAVFTPPNGALQAITSTALLTCAFATFRDGSTNNYTITVNSATVSTQNPFPLTTLPNPAQGNAGNGIFSMSQYQSLKQQNLWPAIDPYFEYTTLLLHGNGTNGAQNNTFLDSSTNNFTITRNGNTTQGSFSPYGANWSNYFDGSGDYFTAPYTTANFDWWTSGSDFTIEAWVFATSLSTWQYTDSAAGVNSVMVGNASATSEVNYWSFGPLSDGTVRFKYYNGANNFVTSTAKITTNTWNHVAMTKTSSGVTVFVNGLAGTTTAISGTPQSSTSYPLIVGQINNACASGYISNLRVVRGTAIYSGNFTPPTTPLTAVTNTKLLTCQSNRFVDNSSNALTLTVTGNTSVQAFSPFAPSAAYSTATIGGSGYFDGSGDYLDASASAGLGGSGNFTLQAWIYPTTVAGDCCIYETRGGTGWVFFINSSGYLQVYDSTATLQTASTTLLKAYQWTHVALVKNSSTCTYYVNGSAAGTFTLSTFQSATRTRVGARNDAGAPYFGWICDLRTDTTNLTITVPTAPLTAGANTNFLLNMTNGGIIDNAMMMNGETVGTAEISTSVVKYGTGSISTPGGTGVKFRPNGTNSADAMFGTGDFTIECWVYITQNTANAYPIGCTQDPYVNDNTSINWMLATNQGSGGAKLNLLLNNNQSGITIITGTSTLSNNVWIHLAATRSSGTVRLFVNGNLETTTANTNNVNTPSSFVFANWGPVGGNRFAGYIDDFRITKGIARYTSNFTPQTSQWQDQ